MSLLRAESLGKSYRSRQVVKDLSLEVASGEVVGLLGPNGAGQTTAFYMIVGLVPSDAGRIWLDDRELTRLPMYRRAQLGVGYLPQEASVFRKLSVEQYDTVIFAGIAFFKVSIILFNLVPYVALCIINR